MPAPLWKTPRIEAKAQRDEEKRRRRARREKKKDDARHRDKGCRFPLCGCRRRGFIGQVSHRKHEGMGGNPAEDRSDPETMVTLCAPRHRESVVSVDKGTLKWEALTPAGSNGPIRWLVDAREFMDLLEVQRAKVRAQWFEVARETGIGAWEPFSPVQRRILADMGRLDR